MIITGDPCVVYRNFSVQIFFTGNAGIPANPVISTVRLQGRSDSQGYPVNFAGKIFAVY